MDMRSSLFQRFFNFCTSSVVVTGQPVCLGLKHAHFNSTILHLYAAKELKNGVELKYTLTDIIL